MPRLTGRILGGFALLTLAAAMLPGPRAGWIINTAAGGGPDGIPALHANLISPSGMAIGPDGKLYFTSWNRVYRLEPAAEVRAVAGVGGNRTFEGDGLPALNAELYYPSGIVFDGAGNLYLADTWNCRVRRVDAATGIITNVAGMSHCGTSGDGGPATEAQLTWPVGLALDASGNLFIADEYNNRVRRVDAATGIITTYAGGGSGNADGVPATSVALSHPSYLALDPAGNLYISDRDNHSIRKVDPATGIITAPFAVQTPLGLAMDVPNGALYAVEGGGTVPKILRCDLATLQITTVAAPIGTFSPDAYPLGGGLAYDGVNHLLYLGDANRNLVRRVTLAGGVKTVAGNGHDWISEDGFPATGTQIYFPVSSAADSAGDLYISEWEVRIRRVDAATGLVSTAMGIPEGGGAAQPLPGGVLLVDSSGNLYIATRDDRILKRDAVTGIVDVVAGTGSYGFSGDGGPATEAQIDGAIPGAVDALGNLYIVDWYNYRVRKVDAVTGYITTVAGNGDEHFSGDGGPAVNAGMTPWDVSVDGQGNLYIADSSDRYTGQTDLHARIRKVDALTGVISTYAGTGVPGSSGDGGPATEAQIYYPNSLALDAYGNLFLTGKRIRRIDAATGIITTVGGSDSWGFYGDGGPATEARFDGMGDLSFDAAGNLYILEQGSFRVRKMSESNLPPVASAGADAEAECTSPAGASVELDGSASSDPDSTAGTNDDIQSFEWFENYGASNQTLLGTGEFLTVTLPLGSHLITLRVTDKAGLSDTDEVTVNVADSTAPSASVSVDPAVLFPPDHRFRKIHATVSTSDACGGVSVVLLEIISNDADSSGWQGRGNDIRSANLGTEDYDFELRAERSGAGDGRIYTVTYLVTDGSGNQTRASAVVTVPHDRRMDPSVPPLP